MAGKEHADRARPSENQSANLTEPVKPEFPKMGMLFTVVFVAWTLVMVGGIVMPGTSLERQAFNELEAISRAFREYKEDVGAWPRHTCQSPSAFSSAYLAGYACLFENAFHEDDWDGPYLCPPFPKDATFDFSGPGKGADTLDPWGECYMVYRFRGGRFLSIASGGPNGVIDTDLEGIFAGKPMEDDMIVTLIGKE
jgi:hypothetical protein